MRTDISANEVNQYRDLGFLVIRDFLTPDELAELRVAVDETVQSMGTRKVAIDGEWESGDSYYDKVFTQRLNLWRLSEPIERHMLSPALGELIGRLTAVSGVRVWHDQALIKEPFANPTSWHLDVPYWSFFSRDAISIWIALDDATEGNGCMHFIPGSHKLAGFGNANIGGNMDDLFGQYPKMAEIDPVAAPMKAGSCSFHNGLTAHAAGANMTRYRRRAMTCGYMPAGSTFNGQQNILSDSYFKSLKVGDVLENDAQNPLIWSR